ncbi:major coat protein [Enterobacter kobei]|uniref:major coat protein n=1 Tax=Enterobacter cloacae complex TaxID=354276 RepID=UPI0020B16FDF|nr:major coat protein [Enterobacter cloacae complex sp.]
MEGQDQAKAAFDSLTAQATEMSGYAWALVVLVVGATVGIKLFKKFVSRAS